MFQTQKEKQDSEFQTDNTQSSPNETSMVFSIRTQNHYARFSVSEFLGNTQEVSVFVATTLYIPQQHRHPERISSGEMKL